MCQTTPIVARIAKVGLVPNQTRKKSELKRIVLKLKLSKHEKSGLLSGSVLLYYYPNGLAILKGFFK